MFGTGRADQGSTVTHHISIFVVTDGKGLVSTVPLLGGHTRLRGQDGGASAGVVGGGRRGWLGEVPIPIFIGKNPVWKSGSIFAATVLICFFPGG